MASYCPELGTKGWAMVKRIVLGFAVVLAAFVVLPTTADATPRVVNGPCAGSGAFKNGGFTKTAAETGVVTIPLADDVAWQGSISAPTGNVPYSGQIKVDLPPPFGSLSIDSWSGTTDSTSNNGVKHYSLPSLTPRGVEFEVSGSHTQGGVSCSGAVKLVVDGSKFGAATIGSLVGTVATGAVLVLAGRPRVRGVV
jgi:hypothetical protein